MSISYYFRNEVSIDMIKDMTDIEVKIYEPNQEQPNLQRSSLQKGDNELAFHLWDYHSEGNFTIGKVIRYAGNDPTEILFELRDKLGVLFLSEYVMGEYIHRKGNPSPPEAAWIDYSYEKRLDFGNPDSIYLPRDAQGNVIPYEDSESDNNHHEGSMPLLDAEDDDLPF